MQDIFDKEGILARLRYKRTHCVLCGAKITKDHWRAHAKILGKTPRHEYWKESEEPGSVRAVSGGLPSLGKRSR